MKKLTAILIDDEPDSLSLLELQIKKHAKDLEIIGKFNNPKEALTQLPLLAPDILFLDIEMPYLNGFDLLECLPEISSRIIFVTAHDQYALKAFRFNAIDYLLKPVHPEELKRALGKAFLAAPPSREQLATSKKQIEEREWLRIAISGHNGIIFLDLSDILYAEASNNYTKIFTVQGKQIITAKTLKDVQETLSESDFIRIHRQFLINVVHIRQFNRNDATITMSNGEALPVARSQKDLLVEKFKWL